MNTVARSGENEIVLSGLTGGNLLAFLAALGTLRTVSLAMPEENVRMSWLPLGGAWRPVVHAPITGNDGLVEVVQAGLSGSSGNDALTFADDPSVEAAIFMENERTATAAATAATRAFADFMAALGSSALINKNGNAQDTAFRTMQGSGHQHLLKTMRDIVAETTTAHIRHALFEQWIPSDERLGLRWDPLENRPYALRWGNPSTDTVLTVRGANRLAIEALPLFPTTGRGRLLETTGFTTPKRGHPSVSWPIWNVPVRVDTVRSLLAIATIQDTSLVRHNLPAIGIAAVYRAERIPTGNNKFRNFTPARAI